MEQARRGIEVQVLERAAKDPQFREQLKEDPRGTVSRDFGVQVPSDIAIEVLEETPQKVYLVLPPVVVARGQELGRDELEVISGGWSSPTGSSPNEGCCNWNTC